MQYVNLRNLEFCVSLTLGLLPLYILRKQDIDFTVYAQTTFPKDFANSISSDYRTDEPDELDKELSMLDNKLLTSKLLNLFWDKFKESDCRPISVPAKYKANRDKKYVCLIPRVLQYSESMPDHLHTLRPKHWIKIADFIKQKGYQVVAMGRSDRTTKELVESIGDISLFWESDISTDSKSDFFFEQLKYMSGAELTIALGGAAHFAFAFDVPGFSIDCLFSSTPQRYFDTLLKNRKTPFYTTKNPHRIYADLRAKGCADYDVYRDYLTDLIIQNLDGFLSGTKEITYPSLPKMTKEFLKATGKHVMSGLKKRTEQEQQKCQAICEACKPYYVEETKIGPRCKVCGCCITLKARWATSHCPKGKW